MNRMVGFLLAAMVLVSTLLPNNITAEAAGQSDWTIMPQPMLAGVGNIRSLAAAGNTAFAIVSNPMPQVAGGASYLVRTTDGGKTWIPVGDFKIAPPADVQILVSPNFGSDNTLFVVASGGSSADQILSSSDRGETFSLLGGVYFPSNEKIRAVALGSGTIAVGTINPAAREGGNLYLFRQGSWKRIVLGDLFFPVRLDIYTLKFTGENSLILIATPDSSDDQNFYEYRIAMTTLTGSIPLPDVSPRRVAIPGLIQASDELSQSFEIAFPGDWASGTDKDTGLVVYSDLWGGGKILRRTGKTPGYQEVYAAEGQSRLTKVVIQGSSQSGIGLAVGISQGMPLAIRSENGGKDWLQIRVGPKYGIDGTGEAQIALGAGTVYIGTGGQRGGVFKSSNLGQSWEDVALYSESYSQLADWQILGDQSILALMVSTSGEGAIFRFKDFWQRVRRLAPVGGDLRKSKVVLAGSTVYLLQGPAGSYFTPDQILRSDDYGSTWGAVSDPDPSQSQPVTQIASANGESIWAQLTNGNITYTFNGGLTWKTSAFSPAGQLSSINVSTGFSNDGTLVGVAGRQAFISRDKGKTWALFGAEIPGSSAVDVIFSPDYSSGRMIYAVTKGSGGGIFYLKDNGDITAVSAWTQIILPSFSGIDPWRFGRPVMWGKALYVPAGEVILVSNDISLPAPVWRAIPFRTLNQSGGENISLEMVEGQIRVYGSVGGSICYLTDAILTSPVTPTPSANPTPTVAPAPTVTPTPTATPVPTVTPTPTATPTPIPMVIPEQLASISENLVVVWGFDTSTQTWVVYDPAAPVPANTLGVLEKEKGYWLQMRAPGRIAYKNSIHSLVKGWNLIGWRE